MSTITTINGVDAISTSRTTINTNFSNLNTDKIETSTLDTDTTLAANSDSKIATQKAVKAYVDSGGNVNASTTARGIVELATQAEFNARTSTGATGAKLVVTPDIMPVATSLLPIPAAGYFTITSENGTGNTTARVGRFIIPFNITVSKLSLYVTSHTTSGTIKVALFSEDGQTQILTATSSSITTTGLVTITISPSVSISAGVYNFMVLYVSTASFAMTTYDDNAAALLVPPSGEPFYGGTLTVTADTIPSTFDPTAVTIVREMFAFRLD